MDDERRIRFLIPPLFLVASILWGLACDGDTGLQDLVVGLDLQAMTTADFLGVLAGGGVVVVTFGFLLGTVTVFLLRTCFRFFGKYHEIVLSDTAIQQVWDHLAIPSAMQTKRNQLFAGVTLDHEMLKKDKEGVHLWLMRRWNAFNVSATSTLALLVSFVGGALLGIRPSAEWVVSTILILAVFVWSACVAWRDTMGMAEFQARRLPASPVVKARAGG